MQFMPWLVVGAVSGVLGVAVFSAAFRKTIPPDFVPYLLRNTEEGEQHTRLILIGIGILLSWMGYFLCSHSLRNMIHK